MAIERTMGMKILKGDVSRIPSPSGVTWVHLDDPRTAPGSLADAELIAQGADTLHGVKLTPFPRPASDYITGVTRDGRDAMISAIIARQVAAGGVDTEGTRHEAERWCAMLAGCVCEGMRATTLMGSLRLVGRELEVVEVFEENNYFSRGTPLSSRDKTPGPHEGATAWASATWEEL